MDINVLLDVPLQRPGHRASEKVLEICGEQAHHGSIAWHTLGTLFYLLAKASDGATANAFLLDLLEQVDVGPASTPLARLALQKGLADTEDALQLVVAEALACDVLITRNVKDFASAEIPVQTPEGFLTSLHSSVWGESSP